MYPFPLLLFAYTIWVHTFFCCANVFGTTRACTRYCVCFLYVGIQANDRLSKAVRDWYNQIKHLVWLEGSGYFGSQKGVKMFAPHVKSV